MIATSSLEVEWLHENHPSPATWGLTGGSFCPQVCGLPRTPHCGAAFHLHGSLGAAKPWHLCTLGSWRSSFFHFIQMRLFYIPCVFVLNCYSLPCITVTDRKLDTVRESLFFRVESWEFRNMALASAQLWLRPHGGWRHSDGKVQLWQEVRGRAFSLPHFPKCHSHGN